MTAYVIFTRESTEDLAELTLYAKKAPLARAGHNLTPKVFYGDFEMLEGNPIEGAVVLEFPTMDEAKAWYNSPLYQEALKHRLAGAHYRAFVIEGVSVKKAG